MKKFTLYLLFLCVLGVFPLAVFGQNSDATRKAAELLMQGKFKDAIAVLDKAVEKNKDLFEVYKLRAALKRMTGDFEGALSDLSAAIEQKADDGEIYEQRAMMRLYTRRDKALVLADLDAALANGRKHEKVYSTRGSVKAQLRDFEGAIADYETAIGMRPEMAGAYLGLSSAYGMMRNEEKSTEVLEKFVAMIENSNTKIGKVDGQVVATSDANKIPVMPGDKNTGMETSVIIRGSTTTGRRYSDGGSSNFNQRDTAFEMEQKKNTAAVYSQLGMVYVRRGDYERASQLVEKSLAIDPQDFMALMTRGKIRTAQGNYAAAIADLDASIKLMPNFSQVYLERGIAKLLSGNEAEAQKDFDKFIEFVPNGKTMVDYEIQKAKERLEK